MLAINTAGDQRSVIAYRICPVHTGTAGTGNVGVVDRVAGIAIKVCTNLAVITDPSVIGLPSGVRGLQHNIRRAVIIAHDKGDLIHRARDGITIRIQPLNPRKIDAGNRIHRNIPTVGNAPVACVCGTRGRIKRGIWLYGCRLVRPAFDHAPPVAIVIAQPEYFDLIIAARIVADVDLKVDLSACIDAEIGRETFYECGVGNVPIRLRHAPVGAGIFFDDLVVGHTGSPFLMRVTGGFDVGALLVGKSCLAARSSDKTQGGTPLHHIGAALIRSWTNWQIAERGLLQMSKRVRLFRYAPDRYR